MKVDKVAIDCTNRIHMLWHAMQDVDRVMKAFLDELNAIQLRTLAPLHCAFDSNVPTFRHRLFAGYKADRPPSTEGLKKALYYAPELVFDRGHFLHVFETFEADDILATIADICVRRGERCVLVSPDKDLRQCLVTDRVNILRSFRRRGNQLNDLEWLTEQKLKDAYGFGPDRWADYQAIVGDHTDGIEGWPGAGDKAARTWLKDRTLEWILNNRWNVKMTPAQNRSFTLFADRYPIVKQLVTLRTDVSILLDDNNAGEAHLKTRTMGQPA